MGKFTRPNIHIHIHIHIYKYIAHACHLLSSILVFIIVGHGYFFRVIVVLAVGVYDFVHNKSRYELNNCVDLVGAKDLLRQRFRL